MFFLYSCASERGDVHDKLVNIVFYDLVFYEVGFESTQSPPNYNLGGPLPKGSVSRAPLLGSRVLRWDVLSNPQPPQTIT